MPERESARPGLGRATGGPETRPWALLTGLWLRPSLKLKLSLLITSLLALTVILLSGFLLRQAQENVTAEIIKRGLAVAKELGASAKNPLLSNDGLTLNLLVKDVMQDPDVAYVVITDHHGRVLAHSELSQIGEVLTRPAGLAPLGDTVLIQTYRDPSRRRLTDFAVPLVFSRVRVGDLYLGFTRRSIEVAMTRVRNRTILISVAMILLGIAGALSLAALLARPILRLVEGTRAIAAGDFTVALPVASQDEIGTLTESFNQMARSLREKEMIKHAFARYVAREVVEELLRDPERLVLSGERREVTVLFCDLRGFTRLSEALGPEDVVLLLNDFYELMIEATFRHEGTLDKFLGDAVMAVFGAPVHQADHCIRAIRTALAMQAGIRRLSARRLQEGMDPVAAGIGVSTGEAVAGTVGTEERMEYTVIGDSVNLAARLESAAKPAQILISQRTWESVNGLVTVRSLGALKVKGKDDAVEAYEVLGMNTA
jgi:adenylate cyclase